MTHIDHSLSSAALRRRRVRAKVSQSLRPRLTVFRSSKNIYAQIILGGKTLAAASTQDINTPGSPIEKANQVGQLIAQKALKLKITAVAFDRGSYKYHGRVKAIAESARKAGLQL